ncbi:MAG TPA: four helix bundle protein [Tepidisphaeraceae bacterium]|nr:four helix bundle protein [Tepidisphaeraceae bacterium]
MAESFKELRVWRNAMDFAEKIFQRSKAFPPEEKYALTDQIRRASRAIGAQIAEAWKKRRYAAAFVLKLNDGEAEGAESQTWIEHPRRCNYWSADTAAALDSQAEAILAQLHVMIRDAHRWCL